MNEISGLLSLFLATVSVSSVGGGPALAFSTPVKLLAIVNLEQRIARLGWYFVPRNVGVRSIGVLGSRFLVGSLVFGSLGFVAIALVAIAIVALGFWAVTSEMVSLATVEAWSASAIALRPVHGILQDVGMMSFTVSVRLGWSPGFIMDMGLIHLLDLLANDIIRQSLILHVCLGSLLVIELNC